MRRWRLEGIYGILPPDLPLGQMLNLAEAALAGGVRILQLRDKKQGFKRALKRARRLAEMVRAYDALLIVNDRPQLALESGADGVHLGRSDMPKSLVALRAELHAESRSLGGKELIIGVSCQGDAAFTRHVLDEGADYVSFGAVFPSQTKREAAPIGLPRLAKARKLFPDANICAIGGITLEALPAVRQAGADCAAVSRALFAASDVVDCARRMTAAWREAAILAS